MRRHRYALSCLALTAGCSTTVEVGGHESVYVPAVVATTTTEYEETLPTFPPYSTILVDEHDDRYIAPTTTTTTPTTLPAQPAPEAPSGICTIPEAEAFAHQILDPYAIPTPAIEFTTTRISNYPFGQAKIELEPCMTRSVVAHELAHYVQALAFGMNFEAVRQNSLLFSTGTWIRGKEFVPGIEYAAHCIGNVLYGYGAYTKCPSSELRDLARQVISLA